MLTLKRNGLVFVVDYDAKNENHVETLEKLKETYGEENILFRSFYIKEYDVDGRRVKVPMFGDNKINRSERRQRRRMRNRINYGEQKTNEEARTKHMKTRREIRRNRRQSRGKVFI